MTHHADEQLRLIADLRTWIRQNTDLGTAWYLDEGDRPDVIPTALATSSPPAPVATAATVATDPDPAPDSASAVEVPSRPRTPAPVTGAAAPAAVQPAPAPTPTPAPAAAAAPKDAAFQAMCDAFVAETLGLIDRAAHADPLRLPDEPLLAAHGGDPAAAMAALRSEVLPCTACDLGATRTHTVFGSGHPRADVVFVGEAPGRDEDLQGEPFVGASGQLLTKILGAIGFAREDVFICNILKCRPPNNRDPLPEEVAHCEPHLQRQLAILRPRIICCLGRVAAQTLLKTDLSLGRLRRTVHFYRGVPVMATFHPAALLRNPKWKRDTWDDVRKLRALCDALRAREG
ncbi:uracil-DNA glycosylase [bacterium]|nr:uracil-DNA glycosylase [bacterium]